MGTMEAMKTRLPGEGFNNSMTNKLMKLYFGFFTR